MFIHQSKCNFTIFLCKMLIANERRISNYHIELSLVFNALLVVCEKVFTDYCCTILRRFFSLNIIQFNPKHIVLNLLIRSTQLSITSGYSTQKTTVTTA